MKHVIIKFEQADQITNFVGIINRYTYDADVKCGNHMVDAKSVVGVLSLTEFKTVELILHTDKCNELLEELAPFTA